MGHRARTRASELERRADELLLEELREIERRGGGGLSSGGPSLGSSFGVDLPFAHTFSGGVPEYPCSPLALMSPVATRRWVVLAVGLQVVVVLLLARGLRRRDWEHGSRE